MKSVTMRENPLFLRNNFPTDGKYAIAKIVPIQPFSSDIKLVACSDTRANDRAENLHKGVHFFVDDYRFQGVYDHPDKSLSKFSQYDFLLTPDFSLYAEMPLWKQIENVAKNRWVGAFWQSKGLVVIPAVSWSTPSSFSFCFDGIEKGSVVAVGMIGCKRDYLSFMRGYVAMLDKIQPSQIIVFGNPFPDMEGNIVAVDYGTSRKVVR